MAQGTVAPTVTGGVGDNISRARTPQELRAVLDMDKAGGGA